MGLASSLVSWSDLTNPEYWKLLSIPFVAAVVGWATNWVAIKLTFLPLEFRGWRRLRLGWQGIIPSKAAKMGAIFVDSTMSRLGKLSELYEKMEPRRLATHVTSRVLPSLDGYTDAIIEESNPELWAKAPQLLKDQIHARLRAGLRARVDHLMTALGERFEELIDFKHMVVEQVTADKAVVNRLFEVPGEKEFTFIVRSGLHFGFLFGLVQLAVWAFLPAWWVLPVFGFAVGYATNWIALNIIFRPLHPHRVGPWTVQGLFLKRQEEVAGIWCHLVTREIITVQHVVTELLNGPRSHLTHDLIRDEIEPLVHDAVGKLEPLAKIMVGADAFEHLKEAVGDKALEISADPFEDPELNEERAEVIEDWLRERMVQLPPEEFQDLLRPCFKEDEWKLVGLGALLGLLAGVAQLFVVFGGLG